MLSLEESVYFAQRRDREALALLFHFQALQRHYLVRLFVLGSVDNTVRALFDSIEAFELLDATAAVQGAKIEKRLGFWWRQRHCHFFLLKLDRCGLYVQVLGASRSKMTNIITK